MRILYLGINYWPDESGIAPFATGRCEYLAECGHEVVACTGLPYYPQWRVAAAYRRRLLVREERAGVSIRRSWMYVPRRLTSLRRMVHEGTFVCSSFMRALCGPRPDLLLVVSPPLGLAASAISRVLSTRGGSLPACRDGLDSHRSDARPHHREARAA